MKKILTLIFLLALTACSPGNKETTSLYDSTSLNDTLTVAGLPDEGTVEEITKEISDTSQLEITFDETAGLVFERQEPYYTVSIVTNQYEASSDVTWYFDNDFSPLYFKETWSAEGNEGLTEYFITAGGVACAHTEEYGNVDKWCNSTGGTRITYNEESDKGTSSLLPADYGSTVNTELSRYRDILKAILNEAEVTDEDENAVTLRIQKTIQIGEEEFEESTTVSIPKKLYDELR